MACPTGNPVVDAVVGFFDFLKNPVGGIIKEMANSILGGAIAAFGAVTNTVPTLPEGGAAQAISDQTRGVVVFVAVGSLLVAAIRMAMERRGEPGVTMLKGVARVVLVAGGATAISTAAAGLSDRFADNLFQAGAEARLNDLACSADSEGIPPFLLLILAFLLLISALVNVIIMFVRLGVVVLLLGTLPLAASASMTDWGTSWWRKHIGWLIAWLLYKPAVALVLFGGSELLSNDADNTLQGRIAGIGILLLSALTLPALLKLVVPATAALGSSNAAGQATMSMASGLASGAKSIGSGGSSPGGAGGAGPTGASGNVGGGGGAGVAGKAGGAGAAGASGAAAAAGPAGAAVAVVQGAVNVATSALDGADGDAGHNR
ncbi:hypothetical protein FKR81_41035 [Lentzea tibetensis]|uniref:TrbL/VirB6 plasmid conjugal transfer protein n=1 Tax=Lentzea tibetensis TaxID=2591470 RepID=A0A563EFG7_9PSEU|nr:hypothetical protein [Lentzea tibetensis]TWP44512.1 hypothetical protein FKR81_41035 [Lentzea tibetensis]